jgi:hypothetical protein
MKKDTALTLRAFLIELVIYTVLVLLYFFSVLHFIGPSLLQLEVHHRYGYALLAVTLVIGQAILLEALTTFLLRLLRGRSE